MATPTSQLRALEKKELFATKPAPSKIDDLVEQRGGIYGHPYDNFANIAGFWSMYLVGRFPEFEAVLDREDVAFMMVLLKVARSISDNEGSADTVDDIAGYAKCIHMIREKAASL